MPHELNFRDESLGRVLMSENVGLSFNSHYLIVTLLFSLNDLAVTSLSDEGNQLVFVLYNCPGLFLSRRFSLLLL